VSPAAVVLATIPPFFAILAERYNPISASAIRSSVIKDLQPARQQNETEHQALVNNVTKLAEGAVEVAGLTPTFVACLTSGFGVLSEYPNPWLIVAYILVFVALVLFLLHYLSGLSFLEMVAVDKKIPFPFASSRRPVHVISRTIYVANFILIAFVILVYVVNEYGYHVVEMWQRLIAHFC